MERCWAADLGVRDAGPLGEQSFVAPRSLPYQAAGSRGSRTV